MIAEPMASAARGDEVQIMTIDDMRIELSKYCDGFNICSDGCRLRKPEGGCRWVELDDESTKDYYWFLVNEGLIGKPEQPEINFIKVDRNDEVEPTNDAVNHPNHYCRNGVERIDIIKAITGDYFDEYCVGTITKYLFRWKDKNGVEDLRKAQRYLSYLIEEAEKNGRK